MNMNSFMGEVQGTILSSRELIASETAFPRFTPLNSGVLIEGKLPEGAKEALLASCYITEAGDCLLASPKKGRNVKKGKPKSHHPKPKTPSPAREPNYVDRESRINIVGNPKYFKMLFRLFKEVVGPEDYSKFPDFLEEFDDMLSRWGADNRLRKEEEPDENDPDYEPKEEE